MEPSPKKARLLSALIVVGWVCLGVSSICMSSLAGSLLSGDTSDDSFQMLLIARGCGIAGFCIGVVSLVNERWTSGALLLLLSMLLPVISLIVAGSL